VSLRLSVATALLILSGCAPTESIEGASLAPGLENQQTLEREIAAASGEEKWLRVFSYGEEVGRHIGPDLVEARRRADALEPEVRLTFYSGMAHTAHWDVEDVDAQVAEIQARVAEEHWPALFIGIYIRYTIVHDADPKLVVPFAERFSKNVGVPPYDGVRIGVQRGLGHDIPAALALAKRYPGEYQAGIFEELGWRVGDDGGLADTALVSALLKDIDASERRPFVHGLCRASWRHGDSWEPYNALFPMLSPDSRESCLNAIGFTIAQQIPEEQELSGVLYGLADPQWGDTIEATYRQSVNRDHSWFAPDLLDYQGTDGVGTGVPAEAP